MFDAVTIEYAFASLVGDELGQRGTNHDADTFRAGNSKSLAEAIRGAATSLETRIQALTFTSVEQANGGAKARLDVAVTKLRRIAESMETRNQKEPEDYHWEIIGCFVSSTAALLESLEQQQR